MMEAEKQIESILEKNECELSYEITFPRFKILPEEVQLALIVLGKNGMVIKMVLKEKTK